MNTFDTRLRDESSFPLTARDLRTVQVNVGLMCNQCCTHCHLACSPNRTERMDWATMQAACEVAVAARARTVDITGGEPPLHPNLARFVVMLREAGLGVQVRTNLTGLLEPGARALSELLADHRVRLVGSLPCYLQEDVDAQRGQGTYERSIESIRRLNVLGYGRYPQLPLDLVYNPAGADLPGDQAELEADYRHELRERFGIAFTNLLTIANMPIGRFRAELDRQGRTERYDSLLRHSFNRQTLERLMCRHQVCLRWDGVLFDCDFNVALGLRVDHGAPDNVRDFDPARLAGRQIVTGDHCFGCTAGSGSSCGGALL